MAKVDTLMALCDQLEHELTQSQDRSRRLLEAVLREGPRTRKACLGPTSKDRRTHTAP